VTEALPAAGGDPAGLPPFDVGQLVLQARVDPVLAVGLVLAAGLYLWGLRELRSRGDRWSPGRTLAWLGGGLGTIAVATMTGLGTYDETLFSVHMVQHMLFSLMAPPLLLMGTPRWLLRALLSPPGVLRVVRVLTKPVVALIVFNAYVAISHWPDLVNLALRVEAVHLLMHTVLVATSFMMWWSVVGRLPELPQLSPPAKMLYLFLQSVLPTVPASFLTFAERPIYRFYESVPHPWIDALTDSRISGLIMKLGGGALLWGIIAVLFFRWNAREEQQHQQDEIAWDDFERELQVWDLRK
jgi:putative membrane protein